MPSNTTITKARRRIRKRRLGRAQKRVRMLAGTPKFPIIPPGTETTAPAPAE
ncbi:MAG: hypothetical protein JWN48_2119 [Myxococcaceae bacterium]|nr:hypothetical protein [Myxococcaceae bacterium]